MNPSSDELVYLHIKGPGKREMESQANFGNTDLWYNIDFNEGKVSGKRVEL